MVDLRITEGAIEAGISWEANGTEVCLIWNDFDVKTTSIDVVVYFHGFAVSGGPQAPLSTFVDISGLASPETGLAHVRKAPTLAIIPRGEAAATGNSGSAWPYYFTSLIRDQGVPSLIRWALSRLAEARMEKVPNSPTELTLGRLILAAHSGGGRAVIDVLPQVVPPVDEVLLCDALYHDPDPNLNFWLSEMLAQPDAGRHRLWVGYGPTTAPFSEQLQRDMAGLLRSAPPQRRIELERYFRVQRVHEAHLDIPHTHLPILLGDTPHRARVNARIASRTETDARSAPATHIDASQRLGTAAQCLAAEGARAVGRYYNYGSGSKVLTQSEAHSLISNGMALWVVFQFWNNEPRWFTAANGRADAVRALQCAREVVGQPEGSAIYFAVDYDEVGTHFDSNIVPYFAAIRDTFTVDGRLPYRIGVYGNGLVCRRLLDMGLASVAWLSCSRGHTEHRQFYNSRRWSLRQTCGVPAICGIDVDTNEIDSDLADFGQFTQLVPLAPAHRIPDAELQDELLRRANEAITAESDPAYPQALDDGVIDTDTLRRSTNGLGGLVWHGTTQAYGDVPHTVRLDIRQALDFLTACIESEPRVRYRLGAKVPFSNAVPGRDFQALDCSGFVREAIRQAEVEPLGFPDGSVVQHDWVRMHGFGAADVVSGKCKDDKVRIAFLRPQESPSRIGHVALIYNGQTLESHGGVGPNARNWTGDNWQALARVYVLT